LVQNTEEAAGQDREALALLGRISEGHQQMREHVEAGSDSSWTR
jgi:hypothetical protein